MLTKELKKKTGISVPALVMSFLCICYIAVIFALKTEYLSPDSIYFVTSARDGVPASEIDLRYRFWILFIRTMGEELIHVFYAVCIFSICYKLGYSLNRNYAVIFIIMVLPSVFYYSTVFLRDIVLFILSLWTVYIVITHRSRLKSSASFLLLFLIVLILRPQLSLVIGLVAMSTLLQSALFNRAVLGAVVSLFFVFSLGVLLSSEVYEAYFAFHYFGHARGQDEVGVMNFLWSNFTQENAALNAFLSPIFFWLIPTRNVGDLMGPLYTYEALMIFFMLVISSSVIFHKLSRNERLILSALMIGFLSSIFFAIAAYDHGGVTRFRLFFYPFLITIFTIALEKRFGIGVFFSTRGISFKRRPKLVR